MEPVVTPFAVDITLDEIRECIKEKNEFREMIFEDFLIFDYVIQKNDSFPNPLLATDAITRRIWQIRRECRGLVVSKTTGKVISRRFHKFFNVNEAPESRSESIDLKEPHIILEKLDGSMIGPFYTQGKLRFATKKGFSQVSQSVETFAIKAKEEKGIDYFAFCSAAIESGWTPLLEYCSRTNPILIDYKEDQLIVTAIRNISTGSYMTHSEVVQFANKYKVPVVNVWKGTAEGYADFESKARFGNGLEGFVIRFDSGRMIKVKTWWYYNLSRGLSVESNANSEKYLWKTILENKYDDLKSFIAADERPALDKFSDDLINGLESSALKLGEEFEEFKKNHNIQPVQKRDISYWLEGREHESFYWKLHSGVEAREAMMYYVLKILNSKKGFEKLGSLVNNITFKNYANQSQSSKIKFSDWH